MNALRYLLLPLLLFSAVNAGAVPTREDFAYGLPLRIDGDQSFHQFELPDVVYRDCRRADLGDLRVFNAAGQVVPHLLREPETRARQKTEVKTSLPIFPLPQAAIAEAGELAIHVERAGDGTVIDIRNGEARDAAAGRSAPVYLLDANRLKEPIEILQLQWPAATPDFLASLQVDTSADLSHWQYLTKVAVARLGHQGLSLDRNRVVLPRANLRYLRLSWGEGRPQVGLTGVQVLTSTRERLEKPRSLTRSLATAADGNGAFRADLGAALPVAQLRILAERNSVVAARLYAAERADGPWRERWHGLVYNLASNGSNLASSAIALAPARQRYWKLVVDPGEARLGGPPQLEVSWQPGRLVFLAQGEGPYTLAYGSAAIQAADFAVDDVFARMPSDVDPPPAIAGEPFPLGGPQALEPVVEISWQQLGLWGVLVLGVLLIGAMSFSLYRRLHDS